LSRQGPAESETQQWQELTNLEVSDSRAFHDFGLGLFLAWFHHHKFSQQQLNEEGSYHLLHLTSDRALFLCCLDRTGVTPFFGKRPYVGEDRFFPSLPSGDRDCDRCAIRWALRYNHSCLAYGDESSTLDWARSPIGHVSGCADCRGGTRDWLVAQILADERNAAPLGGQGCVLQANPALYEFAFSWQAPPEALFNAFLVIQVGVQHGFSGGISCAEIVEPVRSSELDGFVFDTDGARVMALETTAKYEIDSKHLRSKMQAAALLPHLSKNGAYAYVTLSDPRKVSRAAGDRGNWALCEMLREKLRFRLVGVPPGLLSVQKASPPFQGDRLRKLFEHFVEELEQLAEEVSECSQTSTGNST